MQLEARKYLHDVQQAAALIAQFTDGRGFEDYASDAMLRAAVEREFEIIGEALGRLAKLDLEIASGIGEHRRILAFRNILIHGYAIVDDRLVWDIVKSKLPALQTGIAVLRIEP